jgi:hypothetical protein
VKRIKKMRNRRHIKPYTHLGCPMTRSQSVKCLRFCQPDVKGDGPCGRTAPHSLMSRIQMAILSHNKKMLAGSVTAN